MGLGLLARELLRHQHSQRSQATAAPKDHPDKAAPKREWRYEKNGRLAQGAPAANAKNAQPAYGSVVVPLLPSRDCSCFGAARYRIDRHALGSHVSCPKAHDETPSVPYSTAASFSFRWTSQGVGLSGLHLGSLGLGISICTCRRRA